MKNRLEEKCTEAKAAYESALATLGERRAKYNEVADQARPKREAKIRLTERIASVVVELEQATKDFDIVFAEAGYERTKAVKDALNKKAALQTELDALREALVGAETAFEECTLEMGSVGRAYETAHSSALRSYHRWRALEVVVEVAPKLGPVIAAVSGIPSASEDMLGRPMPTPGTYEDAIAKRISYIWDLIVGESRRDYGVGDLPEAEEVGRLDFKGFPRSKWLTPAQAHAAAQRHSQR